MRTLSLRDHIKVCCIMDMNWNELYFNVLCVCLCNVCAFASNIRADMIVCLLVYILSLQSIICILG